MQDIDVIQFCSPLTQEILVRYYLKPLGNVSISHWWYEVSQFNHLIASLKKSKRHHGTCALPLIIVDQFEINECSPYQCNHYRVGVHSWRVCFCLDGSGRLVPKDWSEEPACGSAPDWCTDTWWAVSGHYQWLTGIRSEPNPLILILCSSCVCLREHARCHHSRRIIDINVHHQLSNFEIIQNVFAIACQSEIMTVFPSRRNSWAFQRRGDWRHCVGCESWGPSPGTAGQPGELLEILYWPSSTTAHGLVFQSFPP